QRHERHDGRHELTEEAEAREIRDYGSLPSRERIERATPQQWGPAHHAGHHQRKYNRSAGEFPALTEKRHHADDRQSLYQGELNKTATPEAESLVVPNGRPIA